MTVQIDSLAIDAEAQHVDNAAHIDQLFEQVDKLDGEILDAVAHRTALVRKLAAVTAGASASDETPAYSDLGNDGSVLARMLTRLAQTVR